MEKNNFYKLVIVLLLVLNLGTLGYLFFSAGSKPPMPPPGMQPPPFAAMLQKQLLLTDAQTAQVKEIHERHMMKMDSLNNQYQQALQQYFDLLHAG